MNQYNFNCFLCSTLISEENSSLGRKTGLLENNLNVIFLLRNLLQVPSSHLERQLKENGDDNPEDWINLCDHCTQLTTNARDLNQKTKKIERQIVERITWRSTAEDKKDGEAYHDPGNSSFQRTIKSFVRENVQNTLKDYQGNHNGFLEGDKLANYLASQRNSPTAQISEDEIEFEMEPQPSPSSPHMSPMSEDDYQVTPSTSSSNDDDDDDEKSIEAKTKSKPPKNFTDLKLKCRHCGDQFLDESSVKNHVTTVHGTKKRKFVLCNCPHCNKQFTTKKCLHDHVRFVHLKKFTICCPICGKGFPFNRQKYAHMLSNHKDDPVTLRLQEENGINLIKCPVGCRGVLLLNKNELDKHMERKHNKEGDNRNRKSKKTEEGKFGKGPWICEICGIERTSRGNLYYHRRTVHKVGSNGEPVKEKGMEEPLLCNLCGKGLKNKESLRSHVKFVHEKRFSLSCHVCGMGMSGGRGLKKHLLINHKEDPETKRLGEEEGLKVRRCGVMDCCATFLREEERDKHVERMHGGGGDGRFKCKFCGMGFWMRGKLKCHENRHGKPGGRLKLMIQPS